MKQKKSFKCANCENMYQKIHIKNDHETEISYKCAMFENIF